MPMQRGLHVNVGVACKHGQFPCSYITTCGATTRAGHMPAREGSAEEAAGNG